MFIAEKSVLSIYINATSTNNLTFTAESRKHFLKNPEINLFI
jgi:hypothetical protein